MPSPDEPDVEAAIERIGAHDALLHSVIAVDPGAAAAAVELDAERRAGDSRGPLHGVPVLVKDNIDTAGTLATTAGSTALTGNVAGRDAPVVAALRAAGAVVVGKTNLSEWANFRGSPSTSGWSAVGGLTANPYALDRSAGGSSSGSAAAVAAGFVTLALGTETDGSILCPAALCGCVGLKPTVGLVSTDGVVPISASQDSVGPIAASVELAAIGLDALAGGGHAAALGAGPSGLRIGVARDIAWGGLGAHDALCEQAITALAAAGVRVADAVPITVPDALGEDELVVLLHEFRAGLNAYLAAHPTVAAGSLDDVIAHNRADPVELAHFGQELFERAAATDGLEGHAYLAARRRAVRTARNEGIDAALATAGVDALVAPSYPPAWKSDLVNGDPPHRQSASRLPAVAGYPAITVPVGTVAGLPVGLTLFGAARSESVLLRLAAAVEAWRGPLPAPTFRSPQPG